MLILSAILPVSSCSESKKKLPADTEKKESTSPTQEASSTAGKDDKKAKTAFPTLDILPEGSTLRRVRLPRYDKDFTPVSLLSADKMTVLEGYQIEAESVTVELYDKDSDQQNIKMRSKMARAIYNRDKSTLTAEKAVYIEGRTKDSNFEASGAGMVINMETNCGFIVGPTSTMFQIRQSDSTQPNQPSVKPAKTQKPQ